MLKRNQWLVTGLLALALLGTSLGQATAAAPAQSAFADPAFQQVWERSDKPVAEGRAGRSWTWGPTATESRMEPYQGAPGNQRLVQYFDKARMEINNPNGNRNDPFFVTNGRLVVEMVSGRIQTGENQYNSVLPAEIPVAGDTPDGFIDTPTYATLYNIANIGGVGQRANQLAPGTPIRARLNRAGNVDTMPPGAVPEDPRSTALMYVPETGHNIPQVFWDFLNQQGIVYENGTVPAGYGGQLGRCHGLPHQPSRTGSRIRVAGQDYWVLIQAFERRVLTFNPANPAAFQVEMGNVGLHYRDWRYAPPPDRLPQLAGARLRHRLGQPAGRGGQYRLPERSA